MLLFVLFHFQGFNIFIFADVSNVPSRSKNNALINNLPSDKRTPQLRLIKATLRDSSSYMTDFTVQVI